MGSFKDEILKELKDTPQVNLNPLPTLFIKKNPEPNRLYNFKEQILMDNYMKHISKIKDYFIPENEKKLLIVNLYASVNSDEGIYDYLSSTISSWSVFVRYSLKNKILNIMGNSIGNTPIAKKPEESMLHSVIAEHLRKDILQYQDKIRTINQGYLVLFDSFLQIPPVSSVESLNYELNKKTSHINKILDKYGVKINSLQTLKNLDEIREFH